VISLGRGLTASLRQAGFSEVDAFNVNISLSCCYLIGGVACWFLLSRYGRATIYMGGLAAMLVCLIIIGSLGAVQSRVEGASLGIGIVLVIMTLFNMVGLQQTRQG
jgi:SP family general alpha glucoside:H+ symporter-like MFS transporter